MIIEMISDVPARLMVAYGLILLLAATTAGFVWWRVHYSPLRTEERNRARRRAEQQLRHDPDQAD